MKAIFALVSIILILGLITGCADKGVEPDQTVDVTDNVDVADEKLDPATESELENTFVEDEDLDVGELY
jgi:PBP1b-binding outer membrane lipoprotein LpoB